MQLILSISSYLPLSSYFMLLVSTLWAKDTKIGNQLINARSETVHEKPAFRQALKLRRCIIPAGGFYEWSHAGGKKQPYYIHMADGSPMCLAGLWERWKAPEEENFLETFTILTTSANDLVAPLHDRIPHSPSGRL
jgi:putative SOS response-associated peptidase YedK